MTSAAFAMPDDSRQRVSLRRRSSQSATVTSRAADEALQHVLDRRLRKREGRLPPPGRPEFGGMAVIRGSVDRLGLGQWLVRAAVLAVVAGVLAAAVVRLSRTGESSHSVAGTVLVGKAPLARASISFHRAGGEGFEPVTLTTGQDGGFRIPDEQPLPSGLYAIVVNAVAGGSTAAAGAIPAEYRDPATTPLRVLVTENLSGLRLSVRR